MRRFWTPEEEKRVLELWLKQPPKKVAEILGRSVNSVKLKANKLGIKRFSAPRWTPLEDTLLIENYAFKTRKILSSLLQKRSWDSIWHRAIKLGLKHPCHEIGLVDLKLNDFQLGYLAGLIDGEGDIVLAHRENSNRYTVRVAVYNTNKNAIDHCHAITSMGTVQKQVFTDKKTKYTWVVGKRKEAYALLAIVKDVLIIKKQRAKLVFEWLGEFLNLDSETSPKTQRQKEIVTEIENMKINVMSPLGVF